MIEKSEDANYTVRCGVGLGTALATCISWTAYHSIWWAILHGCLGWFYVFYYAIKYM